MIRLRALVVQIPGNRRLCAFRLDSFVRVNSNRPKPSCLLIVPTYVATDCSSQKLKMSCAGTNPECVHLVAVVVVLGDFNFKICHFLGGGKKGKYKKAHRMPVCCPTQSNQQRRLPCLGLFRSQTAYGKQTAFKRSYIGSLDHLIRLHSATVIRLP